VSDVARTTRREPAVSCPRCGTAMEEVVSIAPTLGEPGLIAYECPNCVYVKSELLQPGTKR
jgi:C4-type Zn-finger protein